VIVEVVGCSPMDCEAIERAGADRIELCAGIVAGGVTPSPGLFKTARAATSLPIMVMVRPREGGFFYSDQEFKSMVEDVLTFGELGADGVVFGVLLENGAIDIERMSQLQMAAGSMKTMCHRAFDVTPDPAQALQDLVSAGIDRVLSSGQATSIIEGLPVLVSLTAEADGWIEVQPCEGIRPENVAQVVATLKPQCIHFGPFVNVWDPTSKLDKPVNYGHHVEVDEACIRGVVEIVRSLE
jgi:copper homeostasis protein